MKKTVCWAIVLMLTLSGAAGLAATGDAIIGLRDENGAVDEIRMLLPTVQIVETQ